MGDSEVILIFFESDSLRKKEKWGNIDYRKVNLKTLPDHQPLPRVQDILNSLFGQAWFTTLDISKTYHQGYMHNKM